MEFEHLFGRRAYVRARDILSVLPMSRPTLGRMERDKLFPKSIWLTTGIKVWKTAEVLQWLRGRDGSGA